MFTISSVFRELTEPIKYEVGDFLLFGIYTCVLVTTINISTLYLQPTASLATLCMDNFLAYLTVL